MFLKVWESVKEWTPRFPSELSLWELESWWTFEFSESGSRGKNPLDWGVPYFVEKLLEHRCLKWVRMPIWTLKNTSYDQKKGWQSNCQIDSRPIKVRNRLDFLACRWHATYHWNILNEGYNFALKLISIEGLHTKLWAPKFVRILTLGILGLPRQNDIRVLVPWPSTKYTIRGKVVASLKSGPWWVLWIHVCSWLVRAPKCSNYALTNLLFGLHRSMWVIELLINLPNPIPEL
jgi:hypothetical protein